MGLGKTLGKTIVMLLLVIILFLLAILWFDYLGVIHAKTAFAPLYEFLGKTPQREEAIAETGNLTVLDLDSERLGKRLQELEIRSQELDKREADIASLEAQNQQIAQELEDRRESQEEREKTFNNMQKKYDDREVNIAKNASNLNSMAPANAVAILVAMDDQDMIDTLRKCDELSEAAGKASQVSYWLSLMPADRVAEIQRKMVNKPTN